MQPPGVFMEIVTKEQALPSSTNEVDHKASDQKGLVIISASASKSIALLVTRGPAKAISSSGTNGGKGLHLHEAGWAFSAEPKRSNCGKRDIV
jgi:hypothetical protein